MWKKQPYTSPSCVGWRFVVSLGDEISKFEPDRKYAKQYGYVKIRRNKHAIFANI